MSIKRTSKIVMTLGLALVMALTTACTPAEAETLRGVLENVDSVNGKVTIVTEDGKTVTVKVTTETEVEADGVSTSLETLEPGASVDVEVKKDEQVARHIKARQAEVESAHGTMLVPVNCGQQLYDVIDITDSRAGLNESKRRVLGFVLVYSPRRGEYRQRLQLGSV